MLSNQLENIRKIRNGMEGHNYALPDCIKFIMEYKKDYSEFSFWDIAALTGDTVSQVYNHNVATGCEYCVSGYLAGKEYYSYIFDVLQYDFEYADSQQIISNKDTYMKKIMHYIDNGIPVLVKSNVNDIHEWNADVGTHCLVVGYENHGKQINLWGCGDKMIHYGINDNSKIDLIFIGENRRQIPLEELFLKAILKMPYWLTLPERNGMFFGPSAFRAWADDINAGRFADNNLDLWCNYGVYVCNLATNGGEPTYLFRKLAAVSPQYHDFLPVAEKIQNLIPAETPTGGRSKLWIELEELGGGLDMEIVKSTMADKEKRQKVADALYNYANRLDDVVKILNQAILPKRNG